VYDVLIEGATVVDGTGAAPRQVTIGMAGGRFVLDEASKGDGARHRIDAGGLVASPGFVDIHTHFDAQVFWDPYLTPSSLHGVTTVVAGNCGFSIAPLHPVDDDYVQRLLARVEGIPLPALKEGVPWNWGSFGEYLDCVEAARPALNFGALVGHSALRRRVLGAYASEEVPAPDGMRDLRAELRLALEAGALGFSSSWGDAHFDGDGNPVPSRFAQTGELVGLCEELAAFPGTQVEFIPTIQSFTERHVDLMTQMSLAARAPLNWNLLLPVDPESCQGKLAASDFAAARRARVVALSYPGPMQARVSFLSSAFDAIPGWSETMALPADELVRVLSDPSERDRLKKLAALGDAPTFGLTRFDELTVADTYTSSSRAYEGRRLGDLASELGQDVFDVLCDLAVDDLRTGFDRQPIGDDATSWELRLATWTDPRVVIGASDAGAHVDMLSMFDYPVALLALARQRQVLPIQEAVRLLTSVPAGLYGLRGLGQIADGYRADLVLFDPGTVGPGRVSWQNDFPGGAGRLYGAPTGVESVFVNGMEIVRGGSLTGARPGRLLRSGVDTGPNF
jgi:N-acyl-D-aspartate/D-glutamate deacylase